VEAVFERGEVVPEGGERQVERLYMEADGIYVRLQRQPKKHLEVRSAIAYEGWKRLPGDRGDYRLCEKRVYCHAGEQFGFWEAQALLQAEEAPLRAAKQAQQAHRWVSKVAQEGWDLDWRIRQKVIDEMARGPVCCMEGNLAHLSAVRMKGKGRSWSPSSARNMAKVLELLANQDIHRWCFRRPDREEMPQKQRIQTRPRSTDPGQFLQASAPALYGPLPNNPWVQWLHQLIHPSHLPN
jgi:hypothetical protein